MRIRLIRRAIAAAFTAVAMTIASTLILTAPAQATAVAQSVPPLAKVDLHAKSATAAPYIAMPKRGGHAGATPNVCCGNMTWHGGPVAHHPRVYLLFWGPQWNSYTNVENYMYYYFNSLGQSSDAWSRITSQYCDRSGCPTFSGAVFAGWVQDTSSPPYAATPAQLAAEAVAGANYFGSAAYGTDAQIFVLSPSGTHPNNFPSAGFCAWHSYTSGTYGFLAFTNMPFVSDAGASCGTNSVLGPYDGFSIVGGHEYAETVTDPALNAWYYINGSGEIGDLCAWKLFAQSMTYGTFAQQLLWSNARSGCSAS